MTYDFSTQIQHGVEYLNSLLPGIKWYESYLFNTHTLNMANNICCVCGQIERTLVIHHSTKEELQDKAFDEDLGFFLPRHIDYENRADAWDQLTFQWKEKILELREDNMPAMLAKENQYVGY